MDKKLKVYDIRAFKPLKSYFIPAGASCLSLSQRGLLSAATGDIVQVIYLHIAKAMTQEVFNLGTEGCLPGAAKTVLFHSGRVERKEKDIGKQALQCLWVVRDVSAIS